MLSRLTGGTIIVDAVVNHYARGAREEGGGKKKKDADMSTPLALLGNTHRQGSFAVAAREARERSKKCSALICAFRSKLRMKCRTGEALLIKTK